MLIDTRTELASGFALDTGGTGRSLVGDVIDQGEAGIFTPGDDLYLVIRVDTTVTSLGAATVQFEFVSDASGSIATDGTATVHHRSAAFPLAQLAAGAVPVIVKLPAGNYERYLGVLANIGTDALTAGKVDAFLTPTPAKWQAYADNVN